MIAILAAICLVLMVLLGLSLHRLRWWHQLAAWYLGSHDPTFWKESRWM